MKTLTIAKFTGLQVQRNSFAEGVGSFEELENCNVTFDNTITSRRGFHDEVLLRSGQIVNQLFEFTDKFVITQNTLHRFRGTKTGQAVSTSGSATVTVNATAHGLSTGDYVSQFTVTNTDAFVSAFPGRQSAFYGAYAVTVVNANQFTFTASQTATASVSSAASAASYQYVTPVTGVGVSVTAGGVGTSRVEKSNKNLYFTSDNGVLKLERNDLPVLKSGIPPGLDLSVTLGLNGAGNKTGPVGIDVQLAYRVVFGRKDANANLVLGAPSEQVVVISGYTTVSGAANFAYASPVLTITSNAHGLTTGDIIQARGSDLGTGMPSTNTSYQVTVTGVNTFTISQSGIVIGAAPRFEYGVFRSGQLTFTIPSEIRSTEYLYQIYRTGFSASQSTVPDPRYQLVQEANITTAQASFGFVTYIDELPDLLRAGNEELYTNYTQETESQANDRPPRASDIALFRNYLFFGNIVGYRSLALNLVAPNNLANLDTVTIGTQTYVFYGNANNQPVGNISTISSFSRVANVVTVTQTNHGFGVGDTVLVTADSTSTTTLTTYTITGVAANTFTFASVAANAAGNLTYEGVTRSGGNRIVKLTIANTSTTVSEAIAATARALAKAINRNSNSTIYCQYISAIDSSPGKLLFNAKDVNAVSYAVTASSSTAGLAFTPTLPTSGTTVSDEQTSEPNQLAISKSNQPEAVPTLNTISVGSRQASILRLVPLRDSLIIIKTDGVFRLNGTTLGDFVVTALDSTVLCKATDSVALLNNSVYCLSNQGVVQITDSAVRIVSRPIEPLFSSVLGLSNLETVTSAVAYESERLYLLSTIKPNSSSSYSDVVYCYNYLTDTWSTSDEVFTAALLANDDKLYLAKPNSTTIKSERKNQNKIDYTGQEYCVPVGVYDTTFCTATTGSSVVVMQFNGKHGLVVPGLVTLSGADASISAVFAGGASDINGLRQATIINDTTLRVTMASSATNSGTGYVQANKGISEFSVSASSTIGSAVVTLTFGYAHGLNTGVAVQINSPDNTLAGAFAATSDITGYRTVTVLSSTDVQIIATNTATASVTGTCLVTDRTQSNLLVTVTTPVNLTPQAYDAFITGNAIYKISGVTRISDTVFVAQLDVQYQALSTALVFLHSAFRRQLKFAPITAGDTGQLKYFIEFQASFRTQDSLTFAIINFSSDSAFSTTPNTWSAKVGTSQTFVNYGGWGLLPWGDFPWGGDIAVTREFTTTPSVILRQYIPPEAYMSTFIQPIIQHKVAGESLDLQAITLVMNMATTRTTR